MNPGLLREPLSLERQGAGRDALGQPSAEWAVVAGSEVLRGRRMKPKAQQDEMVADREREGQQAVFRVRSQPFLSLYQDGDRLVETAGRMMPAGVWEISGWAEVDGTAGMYVDVMVVRKS